MCELLGISAKKKRQWNSVLRSFFSHSIDHPHGWGLAVFPDGGHPALEKDCSEASRSPLLADLLSRPVEAPTLMAHIRRATIGEIKYENCHPFAATDNRGRVWTLAHNGTIFTGANLNAYWCMQTGETDSERILFHIIARVDAEQTRLGRGIDERERFAILSKVVAELAMNNKLNLVVFDGEVLYLHTNFRDSLFYRREGDALLFATRPVDAGAWAPLPFTRLVAVTDGEFVREGLSHGREYVNNPDDYRLVYMNFARL